VYSDGRLTPEQLAAGARAAGLNFAVHRATLPVTGSGTVEWRTSAEESAFIRVEIRRPGGHMAALSNPIILSRP
jgi:hypothetical protein